jgi:hypothetical protein
MAVKMGVVFKLHMYAAEANLVACLQRQLGNVNMELRDILSRSKHPAKFRPYDMIEVTRLEGRKFQCLYAEGERP